MRRPLLLAFLCLLASLAPASARGQGGAAALIEQARARQLAADPYWHALVHYRRSAGGAVESEVISPGFFLAAGGARDPQAELFATLAALFAPPGEAPDQHAQCRFVARYQWLRRVLDWRGVEPPSVRCRNFEAYSLGGEIESLSLVYATGYLSNPASYFGHILLKFNSRRAVVASELLDRSLNYGAEIPPNENGVAYVVKGLFGGYDAGFSEQEFFNFNHAYAENELRDLWEYELELDSEEIARIVAHSWELLGNKFVYYFLRENCAYRMAELLELGTGERLRSGLPYALPSGVFEALAAAQRARGPLVRELRWRPSRQNRFREAFASLSAAQRRAAVAAVGPPALEGAAYAALPAGDKVAVVDALLDYYEYRIISERRDVGLRRRKQALLLERLRLPAQSSAQAEPSRGEAGPPHEGPLPFLVRAGALENSHLGSGLALRVRPVNYDRLAPDVARIPHSSLAMLDLQVVHLADRWRLRSLDFVSVETFNLARTPLPGDGGLAWRFKAGLASDDLQCTACTVLRVEAGAGKAVAFGERALGVAFLDAFVQNRRAPSGVVGVAPMLGAVATLAEGWKSALFAGRRQFLDHGRRGERIVRWENRFGSARRWDVRLSYEEHVAREAQAAISVYW